MKYIRMHQVEAEPMPRGGFNEFMGRYSEPKGSDIPANENPADEGYKVTYPDGYVSWCPKAQFEAAAAFLARMGITCTVDGKEFEEVR